MSKPENQDGGLLIYLKISKIWPNYEKLEPEELFKKKRPKSPQGSKSPRTTCTLLIFCRPMTKDSNFKKVHFEISAFEFKWLRESVFVSNVTKKCVYKYN